MKTIIMKAIIKHVSLYMNACDCLSTELSRTKDRYCAVISTTTMKPQ